MCLLGNILISSLVLSAAAAAQDQQPTFISDTRLVVLHATVVDKHDKIVTNLPESAFKVYENGVEQKLKNFGREDVPVSMGLIIDNSGSMRDKRRRVAAASMDLVKASNPADEVFIVNFNDEANLDAELTNDMRKLEEALEQIDSRGQTAMRDAILASIDYIKKDGKKDKKVLLVVSDGNDTISKVSLEKLVEYARQSEVLIYAIGILSDDDPGEARKAKRALNELTKASGGLAYYPKNLEEVQKICLQVAHEIRNQYILAYSPAIQALDGTFRQIKVTVDGPDKPTARTRSGYYATPGPAKLISENPNGK